MHVPRNCLLAVNLSAGRRAWRAVALPLSRLAESAVAVSGAVAIRAVCLAVPPQWEEGAWRARQPPLPLAHTLGNACGESSRLHPLRVLCPGLRGHSGPPAPSRVSLA